MNHSLFVIAPPLLSLIMTDLGASNKVMGTISMTASFIYGFGALAGGPLGDKIGEAKTITLFLLFSGFSTFIMFAAGAAKSLTFFALALILMAAGASLYHPTANSLISKTFSRHVSESMGLHGVGGTVGVVLTPTIAWFIGSSLGWPVAFAFFGSLCVTFAFLFAKKFGFESHKGERQAAGSTLEALRIRELWLLLVFNIAIGFFMKGVELYFPKYLEENRAVDPMWASVAYTLVLAFGVLGQWMGGKYSDKYGPKRMLILASVVIVVSLLSLLFIPMYLLGIGVFIVLYGVFFYAHQPALNALTGFLSPETHRGAVYGVFFFTSFGIGSISQLISGYLADLYGFDSAFYMITAFAIAALILSFTIPDKREPKGQT
ncbi:MAG: MFS transporter [Candidatus Bathyarchaeia archaeon]